jgi:hypothetical protein
VTIFGGKYGESNGIDRNEPAKGIPLFARTSNQNKHAFARGMDACCVQINVYSILHANHYHHAKPAMKTKIWYVMGENRFKLFYYFFAKHFRQTQFFFAI